MPASDAVPVVAHDSPEVPAPVGSYSRGLEVSAGSRLPFVSGQAPVLLEAVAAAR